MEPTLSENELRRKLVVHYHIFKNAGSSVDRALADSFGTRWQRFDQVKPEARISPRELSEYIAENPQYDAISSHQAVPPVPKVVAKIFPLIFFREPITRAYSAYSFEWGKQRGCSVPEATFGDYVAEKLRHRRGSVIEDFQCLHVANRGFEGRAPARELSDEQLLDNAMGFVESLAFFGLVERFDESMIRMNYFLRPHFPSFIGRIYRENELMKSDRPLDVRIQEVLSKLPSRLAKQLMERNTLDIEFYNRVSERFRHMGFMAPDAPSGP